MRLDHIAFRSNDRYKTAQFFIDCFGYRLGEGEELVNGGFKIEFPDGSTADCLVLEPPEKKKCDFDIPWTTLIPFANNQESDNLVFPEFHQAPEIFISDGSPDSIVGQWVAKHGVGVHHMAYQVESVEKTMKEWREKGYAEFTTDAPLTCPGLTQCFTKPSEITGIIYELIERQTHGFCSKNVGRLMESTKGL